MIKNAVNWEFLNEPLYRWAMFFGAVTLMGVAWRGAVELMK